MNTIYSWLKNLILWIDALFSGIPLPFMEIWGPVGFALGLLLALATYGGFTFYVNGRWCVAREHYRLDNRFIVSMALTIVLMMGGGFVGRNIWLVPGAQSLESIFDLSVFLCAVLFGYPALIAIPMGYILSDLMGGIPPQQLLAWLPGHLLISAFHWVGYSLMGRDPDFRKLRTWGRYLLFVLVFMSFYPIYWGFVCGPLSGVFPTDISYTKITPSIFMTFLVTWALAPPAMLIAYPLCRRAGLYWAHIQGYVKVRPLGERKIIWESGQVKPGHDHDASTAGFPTRLLIAGPVVLLLLVTSGAVSYISLRSGEKAISRLADKLQAMEISVISGQLDRLPSLPLSGDRLCAVAHSANLTAFHQELRASYIDESRQVFIIDRNGRLLVGSHLPPCVQESGIPPVAREAVHVLQQRVPDLPHFVHALSYGFDIVSAAPLSRQTWVARAEVYAGQPEWLIVVVSRKSVFLEGIYKGGSQSSMIIAGLLIVALLLGAALSEALTRPLSQLSLSANVLAAGSPVQRIRPGRITEIIDLACAFNDMAEQLTQHREHLEQLVAHRTGQLELAKEEAEQAARLARERASALSRQTTFIHAVMENIADGVVACDEKGSLTLFNRATREMHGIEQQELPPEQWADHYDLYAADAKTPLKTVDIPLFRAFQGERLHNVEMVIAPKKAGKHHVLASGQPLTDKDGIRIGAVVSMHDITDRKRVEGELLFAKEEAEKANRAKSEFLANMSHEIRTPMNAILGFTQLMQRDPALSDTQRRNLAAINNSGEHLLGLINDVLQISKIEAGRITLKRAPFDLHALLDDMEAMFLFRSRAQGLELDAVRGQEIPRYVVADEGKLRQILINLLGNAMKFTESGRVVLRTNFAPAAPGGPRLVVEVADTGVGIAENERDQIFKPFGRTAMSHRTKEGTGLGLSISREYACLMGGDITVKSRLGEGSVFRLVIDIEAGDADQAPEKHDARRVAGLVAGHATRRILVVDDNADNRAVLSQMLAAVGFAVREAINGKEAVGLFEKWLPHLVLMDMRMPVMDGVEATQRIKATETGQKTPVIAVSASAFEEDREAVLAAGCDDFLGKPIREKLLFETIARHIPVRYLHDDDTLPVLPPETAPPAGRGATFQRLALLPVALRRELHDALVLLDARQINTIIETIRERDPELFAAMKPLADSFAYKRLLDLLAPYIETQ